MRDQCDDFGGAVFAEGVCGFGEGAAGVWEIQRSALVGRSLAVRDEEGVVYRPCRRLGSRICLSRFRLVSSIGMLC